ncbi:MAG: hypothetical protein KC416_00640 [Myxococcales bacterium]|nr:hypothetical protein [Myxococcales bacterium]
MRFPGLLVFLVLLPACGGAAPPMARPAPPTKTVSSEVSARFPLAERNLLRGPVLVAPRMGEVGVSWVEERSDGSKVRHFARATQNGHVFGHRTFAADCPAELGASADLYFLRLCETRLILEPDVTQTNEIDRIEGVSSACPTDAQTRCETKTPKAAKAQAWIAEEPIPCVHANLAGSIIRIACVERAWLGTDVLAMGEQTFIAWVERTGSGHFLRMARWAGKETPPVADAVDIDAGLWDVRLDRATGGFLALLSGARGVRGIWFDGRGRPTLDQWFTDRPSHSARASQSGHYTVVCWAGDDPTCVVAEPDRIVVRYALGSQNEIRRAFPGVLGAMSIAVTDRTPLAGTRYGQWQALEGGGLLKQGPIPVDVGSAGRRTFMAIAEGPRSKVVEILEGGLEAIAPLGPVNTDVAALRADDGGITLTWIEDGALHARHLDHATGQVTKYDLRNGPVATTTTPPVDIDRSGRLITLAHDDFALSALAFGP